VICVCLITTRDEINPCSDKEGSSSNDVVSDDDDHDDDDDAWVLFKGDIMVRVW
jgi:hypothetical protein